MQEPATTSAAVTASITGGMIVIFGPVFGVWITILFSAIVGAMWTLGRVETPSRTVAFLLLFRIVSTAVLLTGGIAMVISEQFGWAQEHVLPAVAFLLGTLGDKFDILRNAAANRIKTLIGGA
ncbi:MAG: hypothetical protein ACK4FF_05390 [Limnobacter sp.]|uniref:hypothetical protein n=1 Tax=Limnobacter sp. TaxID=2003368 RepID=UPI003919A36D